MKTNKKKGIALMSALILMTVIISFTGLFLVLVKTFNLSNYNELYDKGIKPDIVIVDPPRKGCSDTLLQAIEKINPKKIIYISCNPSTLARDLEILKEKYTIDVVQPVDMFPRSFHVETICALSFKGQK